MINVGLSSGYLAGFHITCVNIIFQQQQLCIFSTRSWSQVNDLKETFLGQRTILNISLALNFTNIHIGLAS